VIQQLELKPDKALVSGIATKVAELAKSGSNYATLTLDEAVEYISTTIRKLLKEFDSTRPRISMVGGLMQAGDFLLNKIRQRLPSSLDFHVFYGYQAVIGGIVILDRIEIFEKIQDLLFQLDDFIEANLPQKQLESILFFREPPREWG